MAGRAVSDTWQVGSPYERYIGRWSRQLAPMFLAWLDLPRDQRWVDVGCGTGALSAAILEHGAPADVVGIEPSEGFMKLASQELGDRVRFLAGSADRLPLEDACADAVVSGLVLNFLPDLPGGLADMQRVAAEEATVAAYVWDYAGRMAVIRMFWDAASALDPACAGLHEGVRFPLCGADPLRAAFTAAGLVQVDTTALDLSASFANFEDYWQPFLGGQGPAPAYVATLTEQQVSRLRDRLASLVEAGPGGGFSLPARAWAVRGIRRRPH